MLQTVRVSSSLFANEEDKEIARDRLAVELAERLANPTLLAHASFGLGWVLRHRDTEQAMASFEQNIAIARGGAAYVRMSRLLLKFGGGRCVDQAAA
jgi:hypothetical protein